MPGQGCDLLPNAKFSEDQQNIARKATVSPPPPPLEQDWNWYSLACFLMVYIRGGGEREGSEVAKIVLGGEITR